MPGTKWQLGPKSSIYKPSFGVLGIFLAANLKKTKVCQKSFSSKTGTISEMFFNQKPRQLQTVKLKMCGIN